MYTTQMLLNMPTDSYIYCCYSNSHKQIQQNMHKLEKFDTRKCTTNISYHYDTLTDGKMLAGFILHYSGSFLFCSMFVIKYFHFSMKTGDSVTYIKLERI